MNLKVANWILAPLGALVLGVGIAHSRTRTASLVGAGGLAAASGIVWLANRRKQAACERAGVFVDVDVTEKEILIRGKTTAEDVERYFALVGECVKAAAVKNVARGFFWWSAAAAGLGGIGYHLARR